MAYKTEHVQWQTFMRDPANNKLSVAEAKQKFLKEQYYREWHYPQTFTAAANPASTGVYTAPGSTKLAGVGFSIIGFSTNTNAQFEVYNTQ